MSTLKEDKCPRCNQIVTDETIANRKRYGLICKPCRSNYNKRFNNNARIKVLLHYGATCKCCGDTTQEFLALDHINGGGNKHRKEIGKYGNHIYQWIIKNNFPEGFRVLCHNCNMSLGFYGYCPHNIEKEIQ